ncbi:leucine--tRNA ligase [Thermogladius sp. 4427co]|uniref:leucine--tRNA ligase n=1 Tax=Thermogladius sp. 4427co TaxID=3450718 RepID=UPI003F7AFA32
MWYSSNIGDFLEWLRSIERKWQKIWREKRVFEANPDPARPKFFITVPYPYTNAPLHIGHGRTYTIGDIIARYKRLKGFNVLFPMAFHITGTPIIAISDLIARGDPKVLSRYESYVRMYVQDESRVREILESFKDPYKLAEFFAENVHVDFEALGFSIDWRRKFHTGEPLYHKFVTWQYLKLAEKNLLSKGSHYVTYCLLHKQPEGEDDIEDADVNPVEIVEYTAIKFKLLDRGSSMLAATLRPETIFGATNLWVNPDADYVEFEMGGEAFIASYKAYVKIQHQYPESSPRLIREFKGRELVGKTVRSPLGTQLVVLPAWFVDPDVGTGIVYSEPSDAPYDYVALTDLKNDPQKILVFGIDPMIVNSISPIKIIDVPGVKGHYAEEIVKAMNITDQFDPKLEDATNIVYKEEFYKGIMAVDDPELKGKPVREAREIVRKRLISSGDAIRFFELNRKARCRAGGEIIVAKIVDQWFLDYTSEDLKKKVIEYVNNRLVVKPEKYRKAFIDSINWLEKRPCARKRGIGTKLPFDQDWIIESLSDSTIYMAFYTIIHKLREKNVSPESLKPELFDYVFLGLGRLEDVARETGLPPGFIEELRREFEYWYPVDLRHTSTPHISNHLSFYLIHHIVLFPEKYWPRAITLNEPVIREGAKMSKSKGNVINLRDIAERYSADLFRLYISWAASMDSILDWRDRDVSSVADLLLRFTRLVSDALNSSCENPGRDIASRWFKSNFYRFVRKAEEAMEEYDVRNYVQNAFFNILNLVEKYREFRGKLPCDIRDIVEDWLRILNPVIPHLTEELWSLIGKEGLLSLDKWPEVKTEYFDEEAEVLVNEVESVVEDIKNIVEAVGKKPARIYIIVAADWKKKVIELASKGAGIRDIIRSISPIIGPGREKDIVEVYRAWKSGGIPEKAMIINSAKELEALSSMLDYIARKTGASVLVLSEEEALAKDVQKATKALLGRPAIYIEFD